MTLKDLVTSLETLLQTLRDYELAYGKPLEDDAIYNLIIAQIDRFEDMLHRVTAVEDFTLINVENPKLQERINAYSRGYTSNTIALPPEGDYITNALVKEYGWSFKKSFAYVKFETATTDPLPNKAEMDALIKSGAVRNVRVWIASQFNGIWDESVLIGFAFEDKNEAMVFKLTHQNAV